MKNQMRSRTLTILAVAAYLLMIATACSSGPNGTYSNDNGSITLELKSGGKADLTYMGDVASCTDATSGNQLTLNCKGDAGTTVFTIHDDGSLTGPPGGYMPALRKRK
jgi:hypothetical protein